jgi:uncharacterized membrane protein
VQTEHKRAVPWHDYQLIWGGALLLTVLFMVQVQGGALGLVRIVLGVVYVLYAPGYCLAAVLFPEAGDLDTPARTGASIGLSLALVPFLALLLDQLPWGVRPWPIWIADLGEMAVCTGVALWRRSRRPAMPFPANWQPRAWWRSQTRSTRMLAIALPIALLLLGLAYGWVLHQAASEGYTTSFFILGSGGQAQDYPRTGTAHQQLRVTVGIANRDPTVHRYHLEIWVMDPLGSGRRTLVIREQPFALAPGQTAQHTLAWRLPWSSQDQQVQILLFLGSRPQPYRQLWLWLNPPANPAQGSSP